MMSHLPFHMAFGAEEIPTLADITAMANDTILPKLTAVGITDPEAASFVVAWWLFTFECPIFKNLNFSMFDTMNRWQVAAARPSAALEVLIKHDPSS